MFATNEGAVAAPTAGLHFTPALEAALRERGVGLHRITLHVGAGTFLPVKVDDTTEHKMHSEWGTISAEVAEALNKARAKGGRIVAVGTTSMRVLESAATEDGIVRPFADETAIFITPGYRFRAVDILLTNFHLPRSTLFMLVSAFSGTRDHETRLRARHRKRLSLLFLWRCLPVVSSRELARELIEMANGGYRPLESKPAISRTGQPRRVSRELGVSGSHPAE